jgi:uncharacterized protein
MQFPDETKEQYTAAQAFAAHLALIVKDIQAWVLEGQSAIYNYMKDVPAQMENLIFTNVREYQTSNHNILFAEVHGEATIVTTSRHYQQDYVMRLETQDGKIVHYREYWNPIPAIEAWGGSQNLRQSFNAELIDIS